MSELSQFLVFRLEEQRGAVPLALVERVVRAVAITPLPKAPETVLGVIDVEGRILPVLNIRRKFGLPDRGVTPADQFVIARTEWRTVVLLINEAQGVIELPAAEIVCPGGIIAGLEEIQGFIKLPNGLVLIHDLDKFLSLDEVHALDEAMREEATHEV